MESKHPHILFVMTDQHRRIAMNFWNREPYRSHIFGEADPVVTPCLDAFAEESVVFSQSISNSPVCSPYRGMLFSGLFSGQNGVWNNCSPSRDSELRGDIPTFTDVLAESGYDVGYVGKWHLEKPRPQYDAEGNYIGETPDYRGEHYYPDGSPADNTACWDSLIPRDRNRHIRYMYMYNTCDVFRARADMPAVKRPHYWDNDYRRHTPPDGVWTPAFETDLAIRYSRNRAGERDGDKPFALFVSYNPPHSPYYSREDTDYEMYDRYYAGRDLPPRPNCGCADENNGVYPKGKATPVRGDMQEQRRVYFSHVSGIDRQFGRLLATLREEGLEEDTVVVFHADHGEMMGSHNLRAKNVLFEEALGIPLLIRYGKKLPHRIEDGLVSGVDIMPTVLGLAGLASAVPPGLHGRDYSPALRGEPQVWEASAFYCQERDKGVRTDRYSFVIVEMADGAFATLLFDNQKDPYQYNNLPLAALPLPDREFLLNQLAYWLRKTDDPWYRAGKYENWTVRA